MIVFLTLIYVAVLFVLMRVKVLPNTKPVWATTGLWMVLLLIFLFIPMQWGAPTGPVRIMTRVVQIVPNVSGQVVEVVAEPNVALKKGDILFRIDPVPFQQALDIAKANLVRMQAQSKQDLDALATAQANLRQSVARKVLAQSRYDDDKSLVDSGTYSENRLERRASDLAQAVAAVDPARAWSCALKLNWARLCRTVRLPKSPRPKRNWSRQSGTWIRPSCGRPAMGSLPIWHSRSDRGWSICPLRPRWRLSIPPNLHPSHRFTRFTCVISSQVNRLKLL
ncbi:HlyD family secretion protein [Pseudophaeobacter leonis]|uniref:HlyD family secretion protein n=1 Tax=Pseudophaeobacter leonis TaxID=1144477 RepID=UPI0009F5496E|nr:biotin/lipoyl-binding protein [Pseudophaeobacter leonis]